MKRKSARDKSKKSRVPCTIALIPLLSTKKTKAVCRDETEKKVIFSSGNLRENLANFTFNFHTRVGFLH